MLFVGWSRGVVAGGGLGVLLGRGAVRVDGGGPVLGLVTGLVGASQEKIGEDGGFQKGDLAKQQPVYQGRVGDGGQGDGAEAGAKEGLGIRVGRGLAIDCDGQGCEDEERDLHFPVQGSVRPGDGLGLTADNILKYKRGVTIVLYTGPHSAALAQPRRPSTA